jgi:hypothetical protein
MLVSFWLAFYALMGQIYLVPESFGRWKSFHTRFIFFNRAKALFLATILSNL